MAGTLQLLMAGLLAWAALPVLGAQSLREFTAERQYLNLPVKNGAPKRQMSLEVGGRTVRQFDIELAEAEPDWWAFVDLAPFKGQRIVLRSSPMPESSTALERCEQADELRGGEGLYREQLRPQFHFSSRRGWLNDPNGLVYYRGEYHLYYQHNPYGWNWGNMHWGHAVSPDLVHWRELPIALYPQRYGDWVFSGSAVVDARNSSGFQTGREKVLVAAYTSTGRGECIVFSNDRGRTFTEYGANPVLKHQGRDPRLLWHEPSRRWIMAVYDEAPSQAEQPRQGIAFYASPDLKHWNFQSRIGGFYECPDLFELPLEGRPGERKWVLTAASSEYRVGQFDGRTFTPETPKLPGHRGTTFYAAQTYSDITAGDGRRLQIGWSRVASPGMPFNQMMSFPCELTLRASEEGPRLCFAPARELARLYARQWRWRNLRLKPGENPLAGLQGELWDVEVVFAPEQAQALELAVGGMPVSYGARQQQVTCGGKTNALAPQEGKVHLRLLADRTSLELFGNDGRLYMPLAGAYGPGAAGLKISASGGTATLERLEVRRLKSAWQ